MEGWREGGWRPGVLSPSVSPSLRLSVSPSLNLSISQSLHPHHPGTGNFRPFTYDVPIQRETTHMANAEEAQADVCPFSGHAVIAGFGVPGRAVGELLAARNM